jgi:hypothetical protein
MYDRPLYATMSLAMAALVPFGLSAAVYTDIIAPSSATSSEGNSYQVPLDTGGPERFQQVYSSTLFGGFPQGVSIGEISFRADGPTGNSFDYTLSSVEIHLSTTSKGPDGLSAVFGDNVGLDDRIVIASPFRLMGDGGGVGFLGGWSSGLDFTAQPFLYNPAMGNLLLDIKVFNGAHTSPFDAINATGDSVSSVFAYGAQMPTSGQTSSLGLATLFAVQPIPEPSTVALLVAGLVGLGACAGNKVRRKAKIQ